VEPNLEEFFKYVEEQLKKAGYVEHNIVYRSGVKSHSAYLKNIFVKEDTYLVFRHTSGVFRKKAYLDIFDGHNNYRYSIVTFWDNASFYDECPAFGQLCSGDESSVQAILDLVVQNKPIDRFFVDKVNRDKKFSCKNCMVDKSNRVCIGRNW
jgi:hypothetical protein